MSGVKKDHQTVKKEENSNHFKNGFFAGKFYFHLEQSGGFGGSEALSCLISSIFL
jgi:hypothetical protein